MSHKNPHPSVPSVRLTPAHPQQPGITDWSGKGYSTTVSVRWRADGRLEAPVRFEGRRFSVDAASEAELRQKLADRERKLAIDQLPLRHLTGRERCERAGWQELAR